MTPTPVMVDPSELRTAARNFDVTMGFGGPEWPPTLARARQEFMFAGTGLDGLQTRAALRECMDGVASAIAVIGGRRSAWKSLLERAADEYTGTDMSAANRLAALGDLNRPPRGR